MDPLQTDVGKLIVKARSGFGIYPLEGVTVTVIPEEGASVSASAVTDETGSTPEILLELPQGEDLSPRVYLYTVEAVFPGYQKLIYEGVELYPGVTTVLVLNMTALPEDNGAGLYRYDEEVVIGADGERTVGP